MSRCICISGAELCTNVITGIPRYMLEIIKRIDELIEDDKDLDIRLCIPKGETLFLKSLKNIKIIEIELKKNQKWNTGALKKYVKDNNGIFVGLANNATKLKNSVIVLHDVRALSSKKYDSFIQRFFFKIQTFLISKYSDYIITVSNYQKKVISKKLNFPLEKIYVTYNGYEHMNNIVADYDIFNRFENIKRHEYYYTIGSIAKHKNYEWISKVAEINPDKQFVVAGKQFIDKFGVDFSEYKKNNIVYVGQISDGENKALYENCKAYVHPSLYEGFGIPPLEALAMDKPIFVSSATCLPEIYNKVAFVFEPFDYSINLNSVVYPEKKDIDECLNKCSWYKSAKIILDIFELQSKK